MRALTRWHERAYLVTSTERVGAIKLYLDFGFEPFGDLEKWTAFAKHLTHPLLERALAAK
jgi:hypothetical protein